MPHVQENDYIKNQLRNLRKIIENMILSGMVDINCGITTIHKDGYIEIQFTQSEHCNSPSATVRVNTNCQQDKYSPLFTIAVRDDVRHCYQIFEKQPYTDCFLKKKENVASLLGGIYEAVKANNSRRQVIKPQAVKNYADYIYIDSDEQPALSR